jgi:hypothetical protein
MSRDIDFDAFNFVGTDSDSAMADSVAIQEASFNPPVNCSGRYLEHGRGLRDS